MRRGLHRVHQTRTHTLRVRQFRSPLSLRWVCSPQVNRHRRRPIKIEYRKIDCWLVTIYRFWPLRRSVCLMVCLCGSISLRSAANSQRIASSLDLFISQFISPFTNEGHSIDDKQLDQFSLQLMCLLKRSALQAAACLRTVAAAVVSPTLSRRPLERWLLSCCQLVNDQKSRSNALRSLTHRRQCELNHWPRFQISFCPSNRKKACK